MPLTSSSCRGHQVHSWVVRDWIDTPAPGLRAAGAAFPAGLARPPAARLHLPAAHPRHHTGLPHWPPIGHFFLDSAEGKACSLLAPVAPPCPCCPSLPLRKNLSRRILLGGQSVQKPFEGVGWVMTRTAAGRGRRVSQAAPGLECPARLPPPPISRLPRGAPACRPAETQPRPSPDHLYFVNLFHRYC